MLIWKSPIPLEVKILIHVDGSPRQNLMWSSVKKKWSGPEKCFVCDRHESTDRILFQCPMTVFLWSFLRDCLGWPMSPTSCSSLFFEIVEGCRGKQKVTLFLYAGALWSIWKTHNNVVFNKKVMTSQVQVRFGRFTRH